MQALVRTKIELWCLHLVWDKAAFTDISGLDSEKEDDVIHGGLTAVNHSLIPDTTVKSRTHRPGNLG